MLSRLRREGVDLSYIHEPLGREELSQRLETARASGERSGRGNIRRVQVLELRLQGLNDHQIAERLGCSVHTVRGALGDPDGAKRRARHAQKQYTCADCGHPITNYFNREEALCRTCAGKVGHPPEWDKDRIKAWMQAEARRRGKTPSLSQVKRGEAPFSLGSLQRVFGKNAWRKACEYSGLLARPVGGPHPNDEKAYDVTWEQRATVLRLGGSLTYDGATVQTVEPVNIHNPSDPKERLA
jgi:hypothetical protein